tara:strand:+ start:920 stop:1279 length:360 start_codon:yes stop_codon:yes gene_type:complete
MAKDLENGARSFKSQAVGSDSFALTINVKWLCQLIGLIIALTYTFYQYQTKLANLEREITAHREDIEDLIAHHEKQESARILHLEESIKWYEEAIVEVGGVSLNPLNWIAKKKEKNKGK